ncbi:unnamed protein product [Umbelopsis ramanniana]
MISLYFGQCCHHHPPVTPQHHSNIANFHDHLQVAMNAYLRSAVVKAIEKSSKKKKVENLADLKIKLLSNERVRGLLTIVDETIVDKPGVSQSFMQKHNIKVADCWRPFVNDHFADIVALVDPPINKLISDEDDEDDEVEDDKVEDDEDAKKDKEVIRTISVPIKKVLRNDLSEEFVEFFYQKMNKTQVLATNLFQDLAAATTAIALWVPTIEPNSSSDNALQEIIPIAFREHVTMQLCHAIKWDELLKNASLTLETREIFSFSHVQMIASANFASRGLRQHTAEKFPLWQKGNC